jgi:hypothetical protein
MNHAFFVSGRKTLGDLERKVHGLLLGDGPGDNGMR